MILKDLRQVIIDSAAGKAKAQAELYRYLAPKMYGVCLRYSKDETEAEDNLQEGFLKIFEKIGSFRHEGSFEGWVRRIMVNASLERYRKNHLMHPVEDMGVYDGPELSDQIISQLSAQDLMKIIQELPPRYRMVFNLYVFDGLNHKEIAEEMKILGYNLPSYSVYSEQNGLSIEPLVAYNLLQSIELLSNTSRLLADKAIAGFTVNEDNINVALAKNPILVTALNTVIGYELGAKIAKTAYAEKRAVIDVAEDMTDLSRDELEKLLDPAKLIHGGA